MQSSCPAVIGYIFPGLGTIMNGWLGGSSTAVLILDTCQRLWDTSRLLWCTHTPTHTPKSAPTPTPIGPVLRLRDLHQIRGEAVAYVAVEHLPSSCVQHGIHLAFLPKKQGALAIVSLFVLVVSVTSSSHRKRQPTLTIEISKYRVIASSGEDPPSISPPIEISFAVILQVGPGSVHIVVHHGIQTSTSDVWHVWHELLLIPR